MAVSLLLEASPRAQQQEFEIGHCNWEIGYGESEVKDGEFPSRSIEQQKFCKLFVLKWKFTRNYVK